MTALYSPASTSSLKRTKSFLLALGVGNLTLTPPIPQGQSASRVFCQRNPKSDERNTPPYLSSVRQRPNELLPTVSKTASYA
jgi:hypothetical protein